MSGEKYTIEPDDEPPSRNIGFIRARSVQDVEATITSVKFTENTRDCIKSNGECVSMRRPKVQVEFEAEKTSFSSDFAFDPLMSDQLSCNDDNKFTSLVSSSYVEWENFDDIIGSEVVLESPYKSTSVLIQDPLGSHNYNVLSQFESSYFYTDGLSDFLVDVFVKWVTNRSYGRAEIQDFDVQKNSRARVYFKLKSGDTFSRTFSISRDDRKSKNKKNFGMFNRRQSKDRIYDFWNLCEDSLGYIPGDSDYGKIIGKEVPVFYNSRWRVEK